MTDDRVVVECRNCEFREPFPNLGRARVALANHESSTGHEVGWEIDRVEAGVARAGADAGVCGVEGCENPESPLLDRQSEEATERVDEE